MKETIRFKDLGGWLKFAFIWTLIQFGATILMILFYALIGIYLID